MGKIEKLKKALLAGEEITGKSAWIKWGYYRLGDGIFKLRKRGMNIKTVIMESQNGDRYAKYYIKGAIR